MASKSGCVLLTAHGADGSAAGARQAWTGRDTQSLTQQGSAALARFMGMDPGRAEQIGAFVDIVVPLGAAAGFGAARVAAIRSGRIHLTEHEAVAGSRIGGHTLARHVGRTEAQLRARLAAEPQIPMASSFSSVRTAERAVSRVLRVHAGTVRSWAQTAGQGSRLSLTLDMGTPAGHGVLRSSGRVQTLSKGKRSGNPSFVEAMKLRTSGLGNQRARRGEHGSTADGALPGTGGGVSGFRHEGEGVGRGERR